MRLILCLWVLNISAHADDILAKTNEWKSHLVTAVQSNGITTLRSEKEEYANYRFQYPITADSPKKFKLSFQYHTAPEKPANASFAVSWRWFGADGKESKDASGHFPIAPRTNGFQRILYLLDTPPGVGSLVIQFSSQSTNGKFIPSYLELTDLILAPYGQSKDSLALLAKPLTKSTVEKIWPEKGLRGLNTFTFGALPGNSIDPGEFIADEVFKKMADWNVNLLRLWINVDSDSKWNVKKGEALPPISDDDTMAPYKRHLEGIRIALHLAEKYHIQVVIAAGNILGRKIDVMYNDSDGGGYDQELIKVWKYVAREFGTHPNVIGYDLLNEPNSKAEVARWRKEIIPALTLAIRAIDKNTYLVVEPAPYGLPWGFENFEAVDDPKVVYSFHHYMPQGFTHQGILKYNSPEYLGKSYPGILKKFPTDPAILWDKNELEKSMEIAVQFAEKHKAVMWVGEFSAIRWAPGASQWLKDSIDIFEKHGWSWAYHSYRNWNGWNPTFDADDSQNNDSDGGKMTDRLKVLTDGWGKNAK